MRRLLLFSVLVTLFSLFGLFSTQKVYAGYLYDCADVVIQNSAWIGGGQMGSCNGKDMPVNNVDCPTTYKTGDICAADQQDYYNNPNNPNYTPGITVTCQDYCISGTGTNICAHDLGANTTCKTPSATCQGDASRFCLLYATPTPTPVPTATTAPTATPTPTPPPTVTIQGHFVDKDGNRVAANGKTVTITGGALSLPATATNNPNGTDATFWKISTLSPSSTNYTVTASSLTDYDVLYSLCRNTTTLADGTTCHTAYTSGNSVTVNLPTGGNYADIYFKYAPKYIIYGNVWKDINGNGAHDVTEEWVNNATVSIASRTGDPLVSGSYTTSDTGYYGSSAIFHNGYSYDVTLNSNSIPAGWSAVTNPGTATISNANATVNFPLQKTCNYYDSPSQCGNEYNWCYSSASPPGAGTCTACGTNPQTLNCDLTQGCEITNTSCPAATPIPTATTAPTPTAVPGAKVTVQGRNVDMDGNPLTVNIGQSISLLSNSGVSLTNNSIGAWDFSQIAPDGFRITAAIPAGYTVSYKYFQKNESPPTGNYIPGNSLTTALAKNKDYADIYFKYTPVCTVTTSPAAHNLNIRGMGTVTASVTSGLGSATVSKMRFGSYNGTVASVPAPTSPDTEYTDRTDPYEAQTTANAAGSTAVWGTADLSDGRTCQSTGTTDTDINVAGPTPTPIPPTPTPASSGETCSVPDGVQGTCFGDWYCMGGFCVPRPTLAPEPTPASIYFIFGKIFNDVNGNGLSAGEANYTGAVTIATGKCVGNNCASTTGNYPVSRNGENYYFSNLAAGQYKVTFSGLPANWSFTYPPSIFGTNSLIVTVGAGCSAPAPAACCTGSCTLASQNSVVFLDAGVTTTKDAWIQSVGSDIRWDKEFGFTNPLPSANTYTSIPGTGGMPGIIFSGGKEGLSPNFGANNGQASPNPFNWQVGKYPNIEVFTQSHSLIPTSYRFLLETAERSDIPKKKLLDLCENNVSSNCVLNPSMIHGFYWINEDLALNGTGYTFPSNQNFVILVNGNLRINEKIRVPDGSTVIFSVKGNIMVDKAIGEGAVSNCNAITHNGCSIEGLYSADNNFEAEGTNDCSVGADLRLNIAGTVVANAGRQGGTFVNNRTLCANNSSYPSVTFTQRPDFILNYPSLAKQNPRSWQEVAP